MTVRVPERPRAVLKTYSHLAGERRMPTEYELLTSKLLYYVDKGGFEVDSKLSAWYERWQRASRLRSPDWERFCDPRETTYASYVALERDREAHVDALSRSMEAESYAARLSPAWTALADAALFPLRFALHGLQMAAAYVGHMAPGGRIVVACAMQAADEVRFLQRIAARAADARTRDPAVADRARAAWQSDAAWQPLRALVERLLVTWDWGEAFVALDLAVKPWLDTLVLTTFARRAYDAGDPLLTEVLGSFAQDASWHRAWSKALVEVATEDGSAAAVREWADAWRPAAEHAARALCAPFGVDEPALVRDVRAALAETGLP